jgi:cysteine synthase A
MPEGMSEERKKIMRAYGAELVFTKGGESDVDLSLQKLGEIRATNPARYWVPGQFDNPDNPGPRPPRPRLWEMGGRSAPSWTRRARAACSPGSAATCGAATPR